MCTSASTWINNRIRLIRYLLFISTTDMKSYEKKKISLKSAKVIKWERLLISNRAACMVFAISSITCATSWINFISNNTINVPYILYKTFRNFFWSWNGLHLCNGYWFFLSALANSLLCIDSMCVFHGIYRAKILLQTKLLNYVSLKIIRSNP